MLQKLKLGSELKFDYTNYRGEKKSRHVSYNRTEFGEDDLYYSVPGLRLHCFDLDKKDYRSFYIQNIDMNTFEVIAD